MGKKLGIVSRARTKMASRRARRGQGMTEYAVLIGVILIVAFVVFMFRDQLAGLFNHATGTISNLNSAMTPPAGS